MEEIPLQQVDPIANAPQVRLSWVPHATWYRGQRPLLQPPTPGGGNQFRPCTPRGH